MKNKKWPEENSSLIELSAWHFHLDQYGGKPEIVAEFIRELMLDIQCLKDEKPKDRYRRLFNPEDRKRMTEQPYVRDIMDQNEILQLAVMSVREEKQDVHNLSKWLDQRQEALNQKEQQIKEREIKEREIKLNAKNGFIRRMVANAAKRLGIIRKHP